MGNYSFKEEDWKHISPEAKNFVSSLLEVRGGGNNRKIQKNLAFLRYFPSPLIKIRLMLKNVSQPRLLLTTLG